MSRCPSLRPAVCLALVSAAGAALAGPPPASPAAPHWSWREVRSLSDGVGALAFDALEGTLAVGDARGLWLGRPGAPLARVPLHGPVFDVGFAGAAGSRWLLVATGPGLVRVDPGGAPRRLHPAPGAAAADAARVATLPDLVAVAGAGGVFVSREGRNWQRASQRWPSGAASAVALRARGGGYDCWAVIDGRVWRVRLEPDGRELRATEAVPLVIAAAPRGEPPVDVVFDVAGAEALVLYRDGLAVRAAPDAAWRFDAPALAPGAAATRLREARGRPWLATDRGLFTAETLAGPWRRVPGPVGTRAVHAIAASPQRLFVASEGAVRELDADTSRAAVTPARPAAGEPPIAAVQRAALAYTGLGAGRARKLERGVDRRGWLPILSLRLAGGGDRDNERDDDMAFVSGETRRLFDRQRSESWDYDASLVLSWDLGDLAYHPEAIDVSREAREILKLRDDVLDEVNQLYYERQRALGGLVAARARRDATAAAELRLRAEELAAGLDAWTGGWFARVRRGPRP